MPRGHRGGAGCRPPSSGPARTLNRRHRGALARRSDGNPSNRSARAMRGDSGVVGVVHAAVGLTSLRRRVTLRKSPVRADVL